MALFVQLHIMKSMDQGAHIMKSMDQGAHREKFGLEEELCYTPIICQIMVDHAISAQFVQRKNMKN